jgi:peroxiredoxin
VEDWKGNGVTEVFWDEKYQRYALTCKELMLNGFADREKYERLLKNLERLWSEKSVTEEIYLRLKNEYADKLKKAKRHIANTKSKITARIKESGRQINEINTEIEAITARFSIGEYTKEASSEMVQPLEKQKQLFESAINELKVVYNIKSAQAPPLDQGPAPEPNPTTSAGPPFLQNSESTDEESIILEAPIYEKPPDIRTPIDSRTHSTKIERKKRSWRSILIIALILITAIDLVIWGLILIIGQKKPLSVGDQVPNFTLPDINGKLVSLQDFRGKQVVLYFWWQCPPCKQELPYIQDLSSGGDDRITKLLTINTLDSKNGVIDYMNKNGYDFPVLLDTSNSVITQYMLRNSVPQTIVINPNGKIQNMRAGAFQNEDAFKKFATDGLSQFDRTPPQISGINLSTKSILSWKTDIKTRSSLQVIQVDGNVISRHVTENWTISHSVDLDKMKIPEYAKIKIFSTDYFGNNASAEFTPIKTPTQNTDLSVLVIVNEDGTIYQEDKYLPVDFENGGTKKYICYGRISNTTHNIVTVGWSVHLVSCPTGGEHSVFAAADEVAIDGYRGQIVKIPISIDGNAPSGLYQFKIDFYGL